MTPDEKDAISFCAGIALAALFVFGALSAAAVFIVRNF